jgi:hypothetical protein
MYIFISKVRPFLSCSSMKANWQILTKMSNANDALYVKVDVVAFARAGGFPGRGGRGRGGLLAAAHLA